MIGSCCCQHFDSVGTAGCCSTALNSCDSFDYQRRFDSWSACSLSSWKDVKRKICFWKCVISRNGTGIFSEYFLVQATFSIELKIFT